jgi:hypothetical protein
VTTAGDSRMAAVLDETRDVILAMPRTTPLLTPVIMTIPLQLLAYHIAVRLGCDVDQPRNPRQVSHGGSSEYKDRLQADLSKGGTCPRSRRRTAPVPPKTEGVSGLSAEAGGVADLSAEAGGVADLSRRSRRRSGPVPPKRRRSGPVRRSGGVADLSRQKPAA